MARASIVRARVTWLPLRKALLVMLVLASIAALVWGGVSYQTRQQAKENRQQLNQAVALFVAYAQGKGIRMELQGANLEPNTWVFVYKDGEGAAWALVRVGETWLTPIPIQQ